MYLESVSSGPVRSTPLRQDPSGPAASMEHVLHALSIGERALAKDLFSRVSKTAFRSCIESTRMGTAKFPEISRITAESVDLDEVSALFISTRALWVRPALESASQLEHTILSLGREISSAFEGKTQVYLIDSLVTKIGDREEGFVSFEWKQKYGLV